jgi:DNA-binding IclR family transcriptional regulator
LKSLRKALQVLEVFLNVGYVEIRLSELAKMTGLNAATVNRIVSVFVELGYMTQTERRGTYMLGTKFLNFSAIIKQRNRIRDIARPYIVDLHHSTGESVMIMNWDGEKLIVVDAAFSKAMRLNPAPGVIVPLYCTGAGKVILAGMTEFELDNYCRDHEMTALTENTITDPDELKTYLKKVAREWFACELEERYPGINNVGAPIWDAEDSIVGCISVTGSSSSLTQNKINQIIPDLKKVALQISRELGYLDVETIPA